MICVSDFSRRVVLSAALLLVGGPGVPSLARGADSQTETPAPLAGEVEAAFVVGYATGLLEQAHGLRDFKLVFDAPVLEVRFSDTPSVAVDKLARSLLEVRGVERVRILQDSQLVVDESDVEGAESPVVGSTADGSVEAEAEKTEPGYQIFPSNEMFKPLIADPRWPRFSATYQEYLDDELDRGAAVSFGETFALVRSPDHAWGDWEIAFQAGVFSVFDIDSTSFDLVNTDFTAGLSASHHFGDLTTMLRVYHQSSHLGDEFLLTNQVDRVNLSYEVLDLLLSFEPWRWLRVYGGGGLYLHREPNLERGLLQTGVELTSPVAYIAGYLRPVAALDLQNREESNWKPDLSLRAGVQIEHPALENRRLQLLGEYYDGRSPNGQFLEQSIRTVGVGVFLGF